MATARSTICKAIKAGLINDVNGTAPYQLNLTEVENRTVALEGLTLDTVTVTPGRETRRYEMSEQVFKRVVINIRIYIVSEPLDPEARLEDYISDIECWIDSNRKLKFPTDYNPNLPQGVEDSTLDMSIVSISTDEGVLLPVAIGNIELAVDYTNPALSCL